MPDQYKLPLDSIILGFTGPIGSGCSYIARGLEHISNSRYKYLSLSSILKKIYGERNPGKAPSVEELQNLGNDLRSSNQTGYLVFELLEKELRGFEGDRLIIDSIKNEGEVLALRRWPNFYLFSVHADTNVRKARCLDNDRFENGDKFDLADMRDQLEQYAFGQQVKKCDYLSDIIIYNNKQIPSFASQQKDEYLRYIYNQYVKLIEDSMVFEQKIKETKSPNKHELCMTIAYSLSKMSSCIKRKVGALIVEEDIAQGRIENTANAVTSIPFVVSSGFNEVPLGLNKCIFDQPYEQCYRDYLQEEHAKEYKKCPKCGESISVDIKCQCGAAYSEYVKFCKSCHKEIEYKYVCKCGIEPFVTYLPGGKGSPGKLLDMCRALHAEEMALLRLAKTGRGSSENLVLYTTTQPCNLCANKIVAAGIKTVVFAEPYSMKESEEILNNGGVERKRFEGVKSSAYFRLYR